MKQQYSNQLMVLVFFVSGVINTTETKEIQKITKTMTLTVD